MNALITSLSRLAASLLAVPLLAGSLAAAVTAKLESATTLSVTVHKQVKTIPANRDISKGASLYLSVSGHHAAFDARLSGFKLTLTEDGQGQGNFSLPDTRVGKHSTRLILKSDFPMKGNLHVRMKWSGYRAGGVSQVQVGPNLVQVIPPILTQADSSFPVIVDKNGLTVVTTTEQYASTAGMLPGWFSFSLEVEFVPGPPCGAKAYAIPCGARLEATLRSRQLTLDLTQTYSNCPTFLLIGFEKDHLRIPNTPCHLLLKIAWFGGFRTDSRGAIRFRLPLPSGVPLRFFAQMATITFLHGNLLLEMTNGIEVDCVP